MSHSADSFSPCHRTRVTMPMHMSHSADSFSSCQRTHMPGGYGKAMATCAFCLFNTHNLKIAIRETSATSRTILPHDNAHLRPHDTCHHGQSCLMIHAIRNLTPKRHLQGSGIKNEDAQLLRKRGAATEQREQHLDNAPNWIHGMRSGPSSHTFHICMYI